MLSGVVLTKNSEKRLGRCLASLEFCDEIIVIDDFSEDNTLQIAKNFKVKVFQKRLDDDFSKQRNFGINKASGDWVFFVDDDETVTEDLAREIIKKIKKTRLKGFYINRRDIWLGKKFFHGENGKRPVLRLGRKDSSSWIRAVHEEWKINGPKGKLRNILYHNPHPSITSFIKDINLYSTIHARENLKEGKKSTLFKICFFPVIKLFHNYFFRMGFLDGVYGFVAALLMSFHSFLSWSKLWFLQKSEKKLN